MPRATVAIGSDPLSSAASFYGASINELMRMGASAPLNSVFVTDAFASHLAMEGDQAYRCEYAGERRTPPKRRMHSLRRSARA